MLKERLTKKATRRIFFYCLFYLAIGIYGAIINISLNIERANCFYDTFIGILAPLVVFIGGFFIYLGICCTGEEHEYYNDQDPAS